MVMKKYIVRLTDEERERLEDVVRRGKGQAVKIQHARILLKVDVNGPAWTDEKCADAFVCHVNTPRNMRQRFVEQGLEAALERKKMPPRQDLILDGRKEARLIALSCSPPPKGRSRWTLRLLAEKLVALKVVDAISYETVRRALKKTL
jgi:hypothetical protein